MTNNTEKAEIKVSDFGLSQVIGPNELAQTTVGTLCYAAPEIFLGQPCGKEVDFWSIGVIIFLLVSGHLPFDSLDDSEVARKTIEE